MVNLLAKFLGDLSLESHYLKGMTFSEHCRTPAKRGKTLTKILKVLL